MFFQHPLPWHWGTVRTLTGLTKSAHSRAIQHAFYIGQHVERQGLKERRHKSEWKTLPTHSARLKKMTLPWSAAKKIVAEEKIVLITAPHAHCFPPDESERICDLVAKQCASYLGKKIEAFGAASSTEPGGGGKRSKKIVTTDGQFVATSLRSECDLNRDSCLESPYRDKLRAFVVANVDNICLALDVHSFEAAYDEWRGNDLVILDERSSQAPARTTATPSSAVAWTWYALSLLQHCKQANLTAKLVAGRHNSIIREVRSLGRQLGTSRAEIPALLLEFNEGQDARRLEQVASVVASWATSFVLHAKLSQQDGKTIRV